jgi:serine/threonine protein kinase
MAEPSDDEWHLVRAAEYFQPAAAVMHRKQIQEWGKTPGHWSGTGKHTKLSEIKGKLHAEALLGHGATGLVERVTFRSVTMARKKIRVRGMVVEQLREEANIMEKLAHRHIVELVGTYTHGQRDLYILTYPAAICNLQSFLDDIDEVGFGTSADVPDATKRFEALGFKNVVSCQPGSGDLELRLDRPLNFLASTLGCVTEAVAFVHKNNVRHQDLKPRNILLSPRQVYLADFGISRDLKDATHSLTEGFPGGTPDYRAPEVTQGEKHHMSPADIYSLGCVFLTVASVLYFAPHGQYETVLKEEDLTKKATAIREFISDLRRRASRLGKAAHDAPTCAPKHLLNLIESMLSEDPKARPTACQVNGALHELGGIDQVYHGKCCKKDTSYITQLIGEELISLTILLALLILSR